VPFAVWFSTDESQVPVVATSLGRACRDHVPGSGGRRPHRRSAPGPIQTSCLLRWTPSLECWDHAQRFRQAQPAGSVGRACRGHVARRDGDFDKLNRPRCLGSETYVW